MENSEVTGLMEMNTRSFAFHTICFFLIGGIGGFFVGQTVGWEQEQSWWERHAINMGHAEWFDRPDGSEGWRWKPMAGEVARRPAVPEAGSTRWNLSKNRIEAWNGSVWVVVFDPDWVKVDFQKSPFSDGDIRIEGVPN